MSCSLENLERLSSIAKSEIKEDTKNMSTAVENVRNLVKEKYGDLYLPPDRDVTDNIIERCLRTRKFDENLAAKQVHLFFKLMKDTRLAHKEMLFLPSLHQSYFYDSSALCLLKHRDSKGRQIVIGRTSLVPSKTFCLDKAMSACVILLNEMARLSVDTQRLGVVIILDIKGYDFGHAKTFTLSRIRTIGKALQGSFPLRFKAIHLVNCPILFTYTFTLIKPFLPEKIRNRIHFGSSDFAELHKDISPEILPDFLGGQLPEDDYANMDFIKSFVTTDDYYNGLFKYGYFLKDKGQQVH